MPEISPLASDEVWLRRLMVDVAGRLPTVEEVKEFILDQGAEKWQRWVERAAGFPETAEWRFRRVADALCVRDEG